MLLSYFLHITYWTIKEKAELSHYCSITFEVRGFPVPLRRFWRKIIWEVWKNPSFSPFDGRNHAEKTLSEGFSATMMPSFWGLLASFRGKRIQNEVQTEDFSRNVWRGEKNNCNFVPELNWGIMRLSLYKRKRSASLMFRLARCGFRYLWRRRALRQPPNECRRIRRLKKRYQPPHYGGIQDGEKP